jgi:hypothetical protein
MTEVGRIVFFIRSGKFSLGAVDLKIGGDFVGVMSCREAPHDMDLFTLVDHTKKKVHNVSN